MKYYVNCKAEAGGDGSVGRPFNKIQSAADVAVPGDEIIVYPGVYREAVSPVNGGREDARIVYRSKEKLGAVITGAEPLTGWIKTGEIWRAEVPNSVFTGRNPYTAVLSGDWLSRGASGHLGDVFLNGRSMYEADSLDGVTDPPTDTISWEPEYARFTWYSEQDEKRGVTVFYANFGEFDPNAENVEFTVRAACFAPEKEGVGFITLSGFTVCKAATQWAPPTAYQEGMIAPHWSRGWIIEDCEVYESKCSGISLGKYLQKDNENKWLNRKFKHGTQTERECIMKAQADGWSKETVGGHTVRRCHIHDCGQTGIVGHLGGVFSVIEDNHIHNICNKMNIFGAETGGIKMHAAIDVVFRGNRIHHCVRGLWLDWQAQGTRVTRNLFYDNTLPHPHLMNDRAADAGNGEDIFVEVSHGPTLIDHNLLISDRAIKLPAQGIAIVHNLIAGSFVSVGRGTDNGASFPSPRYTPYHFPHRTEVAGFMTFLHGDMRVFNNIFVQKDVRPFMKEREKKSENSQWDDGNTVVGLNTYAGYPTREEWERQFDGYCGMGADNRDLYYSHLPVESGGNVFFNGARPWEKEKNSVCVAERRVSVSIREKDGTPALCADLDGLVPHGLCRLIDTDALGEAFEPEQRFENPDGTPLSLDTDWFGEKAGKEILPGPFADGRYDGRKLIFRSE